MENEFIVLADGLISYRGTGGDQERISVNAGKKAYLNFMTGKGKYKVITFNQEMNMKKIALYMLMLASALDCLR